MSETVRGWARTLAVAAGLAVVCAFLWWAWMGRLDRKTYTEFEVVGCGVCVALAVVAARLLVPPRRGWLMTIAATAGFSYSLGKTASAYDTTGLWLAGEFFLVVGMLFGLTVLWRIVESVRAVARWRGPTP
ncbi:hypothetical protein [Segniliparus rugosus]|nr:hypothetical protein [Segniliparus rugosus]